MSIFNNKTIICVDIQPEYAVLIPFIKQWVAFVNRQFRDNDFVMLFNGPEIGYISEPKYKEWLSKLGVLPAAIDSMIFHSKSYGFFRDAIDAGISESRIVNLLKYMIRHRVHNVATLAKNQWNEIGDDDLEFLFFDDSNYMFIPPLVHFLGDYENIVLTGGSKNQCLKEIRLALESTDSKYEVYHPFVYG